MLGNPCIQIALQHADEIRSQRNRQRENDKSDERTHVPTDQSLIDDTAGEHRRHQREDG